ncbi:MAG: UMP kinase, partial [Calditrichota bacterium]
MPSKPAYQRVLLKLSGESLSGSSGYGISLDVLKQYAAEIKSVVKLGVQVGVVVGG